MTGSTDFPDRKGRGMRENKGMKIFVTIILVILLALIAVAIALLGTGKAAELLEKRGITFLSHKDKAETTAMTSETETAAPAAAEDAAAEAGAAAEVPAEPADPGVLMIGDKEVNNGIVFSRTAATRAPAAGELTSTNCILVNLQDDSIVLAQGEEERISPASMTKVMTLMVAAEYMDPDTPVTITDEMIKYCADNGLSAAGFELGKTYTVHDMMYGAILPSGGEAVAALAITGAGSEEDYVGVMNQKLTDSGLSDSAHFTNCAGSYDVNHYCTLTDMAAIMKAALVNDTAREVLTSKVYTIPATEAGKEDLVLSNWFLRKIEEMDCGGTVLAAKTGYVEQAGYCAVSYFISNSGVPYICVTVHSDSDDNCISDHAKIYRTYAV